MLCYDSQLLSSMFVSDVSDDWVSAYIWLSTLIHWLVRWMNVWLQFLPSDRFVVITGIWIPPRGWLTDCLESESATRLAVIFWNQRFFFWTISNYSDNFWNDELLRNVVSLFVNIVHCFVIDRLNCWQWNFAINDWLWVASFSLCVTCCDRML